MHQSSYFVHFDMNSIFTYIMHRGGCNMCCSSFFCKFCMRVCVKCKCIAAPAPTSTSILECCARAFDAVCSALMRCSEVMHVFVPVYPRAQLLQTIHKI